MKIWIKKGSFFMKFKQHDYTFVKVLFVWFRFKQTGKNWFNRKRISI